MAPKQRTPSKANRSRQKTGRSRQKLDPRLALLLSLTDRQRRALKAQEDKRIQQLTLEIYEAVGGLDDDKNRDKASKRLRELDRQLFAPLTTGLFIPERGRGKVWPFRMKESFASAFILSDASADDLKRLGARVRSQVGDIFSAFVPLSAIPKLEKSAAIRYIELTRPLFRTLDVAVPFAQLDTLHNAMPPIDGTGVIVGVIDTRLDIYHPDFRTAANATRVLFLWDQTLVPQAGEAGPPVAPALPGFTPAGGTTYGVEYNQATIDNELNNPPPAYQIVRHGGTVAEHGTHVAGIAAGNGLGQAGTFTGGAPGADIIFVRQTGAAPTALFGDSAGMADAFAYVFARASLLGQACVINMSASDNQGPHDGMTLGEQFLDNLLLTPGRAITLSAGNSNNTSSHAAGNVPMGGTANLLLNYAAGTGNSDDVEIWYDGHDRFDVTVTVPSAPATVIGPVNPGGMANNLLPNGVQVQVTSVLNDPRNGDNLISIIFTVPAGQTIPAGNTTIALTGTIVVNGTFQAWVDRNNRFLSAFQAPFLQEGTLTLGVPATARRPITVGNHNKTAPTPAISGSSGRGPARDGRIKPEIATVGSNVTAPRSRNMNAAVPGALYTVMGGTSMAAPLVAGACACLFQCRGGASTWANLKQILEDTAGTVGLAIPGNDFGFGFMQIGGGCAAPAPNVDVWLRDDATDTGVEPFAGSVAWLSPDIEVLDTAGNPVPNPTFDPIKRFNNIIRVTVRNRGTNTARNTEVYFYWADPATNIPYPAAWNTTGIYNDAPGFVNQSNMIVIPQLAAGASTQVQFGWAPPAPGSNIRGDDHFCLLVRLENEGDLSQIGVGGWSAITARNNIGLHNVHVQPDDPTDSDMSFYIVGSAEQDSLTVYPNVAGGRVSLILPVQALPWRDIRLIERNNGRRVGFGCCGATDPLHGIKKTLKGEQIRAITDIAGAELLDLRDGIATVTMGKADRLHVPYLRIADGARMVARIHLHRAKTHEERRFVHVAQHSGGQLVGGVSLELRPRQKRGRVG
ncbi:MAG: S8 family serine peptidase [Pyrinomonadaceae bacterium]